MKNNSYNLMVTLPRSKQNVCVAVQKKQITTYRIRVKSTTEVCCSAPLRASKKSIDEFINRNLDWLEENFNESKRKAQLRFNTNIFNGKPVMILGNRKNVDIKLGKKNDVEITAGELIIYSKNPENEEYTLKVFEEYARSILYNIVSLYVKEYSDRFNIEIIPEIKIGKMKTMWGNCYYEKNLMHFNLNLIYTPISSIEYIVLHEMSHLFYHNHSKDFYDFIEKYMPNYRTREQVLTRY